MYLFLAYNDGLTSLDLSWNKIQPQGAVSICHALRVSKFHENLLVPTELDINLPMINNKILLKMHSE